MFWLSTKKSAKLIKSHQSLTVWAESNSEKITTFPVSNAESASMLWHNDGTLFWFPDANSNSKTGNGSQAASSILCHSYMQGTEMETK